MVLWQSPDTPFLSWFLVSNALSCLSALFHVGAWCSDPGTLVLFRFRVGVRTLTLQVLVLLWEHAVSSLLGLCAPLSMCIRCLCFDFSCFVLFLFVSACVFHWLCAFMFVMFCVNTRLMSLLISCVFMSRFAPNGGWFHWNASRSAGRRGCISPGGGRWCCSPASGGRQSCSAPSGGRRSCPALGDGGGTGVRLLPPFKAWRLFQSPIQSGSPHSPLQSPLQSRSPQSPLHPSSWPCRLHPSSLPCRLHPSSLPCRLHPSTLLWRLRPCFLSYRGCPSCLQSFWLCPGLLTGLLTCLSLLGLSLRPCPGRPPGLQNCWSPLGSTLPSHPGPS